MRKKILLPGLCVLISLFSVLNIVYSSESSRFVVPQLSFKSEYLAFTPQLIIFLPPDYYISDKHYPVMYAHDGQNLFDPKTAFSETWRMHENIEYLLTNGLMEEIIVVGIYNTARRMYDYTPTQISNERVQNQGGDLENHALYLTEELKPWIDKNFRTFPDRKNTAIMGSSLGGLASFYIIGKYPEIFGKAAVISPSFWWDNVRVIDDIKNLKFSEDVKIYMDGGYLEDTKNNTMVLNMRKVYSELKKIGLGDIKNIFYYEDPQGGHNEYHWAKRGKMPFYYLFGKLDTKPKGVSLRFDPPVILTGDTATFIAEIEMGNGMSFTCVDTEIKSTDRSRAVISSGKLVAKKEGVAEFDIYFSGEKFKRELYIFPRKDGYSHRFLRVYSSEPVDKIEMEILFAGSDKTEVVGMRALDKHTFEAPLSYPTGERLRFRLRNHKEQYAATSAGRILSRGLIFSENRLTEIEVDNWE